MKPDNSGASAATRAASERMSAARGERSNKRVTLSLAPAGTGSTLILHCQGRIFFRGEAQTLSTIVSEVLPSMRCMVVDLGGVSSIDSGALGELVLTHLWAEAAGYSLKFSNPTSPVRQLLETTNLVSVLDVYSNVEDALAAMQQEEVHLA